MMYIVHNIPNVRVVRGEREERGERRGSNGSLVLQLTKYLKSMSCFLVNSILQTTETNPSDKRL